MKIMVVGGGGREHAIVKKLNESPRVSEIFVLPGNGGMVGDATPVNIGAKDLDGIGKFATENAIDYAVVAPDDPLVLGCVDRLTEAGIPCFGPRANAAIIEGSKVFSKNLMKKYGIPTASYEVFETAADAYNYLKTAPIPTVIKADGLALGKGVIIATTRDEALDAVKSIMEEGKFGASGNKIVVVLVSRPGVAKVQLDTGEIRTSHFHQLRKIGHDLVGAVTPAPVIVDNGNHQSPGRPGLNGPGVIVQQLFSGRTAKAMVDTGQAAVFTKDLLFQWPHTVFGFPTGKTGGTVEQDLTGMDGFLFKFYDATFKPFQRHTGFEHDLGLLSF